MGRTCQDLQPWLKGNRPRKLTEIGMAQLGADVPNMEVRMKIVPKLFCIECEAEAKITTLFLRNRYCSADCLAEGQLRIAKWLAEVIHEVG